MASAVVVLANVSILMMVSASLAVHQDNDPDSNSGAPVTDGANMTLTVVLVLLLVNAALLALSRQTRQIGIGAVLGVVASIPVAFVVGALAFFSLLGES